MRRAISRRNFLGLTIGAAGLTKIAPTAEITSRRKSNSNFIQQAIDRRALVTRNHPTLYKFDPLSPLSVGNGEFAFTADVTGLQTFPREYENSMPLCTMSQWGWHTTPLPAGLDPKAFRLTQYETHGRLIGYATSDDGQRQLFKWLRENPHRLHLGQIGLRLRRGDGSEAQPTDVSAIAQSLDLWTGILVSHFKFEGEPVRVKTAVHPDLDLLSVAIESNLIGAQRLAVRIAFPFGSVEMQAADWSKLDRHRSEVIGQSKHTVDISRTLDRDKYYVAIAWSGEASLATEKTHEFLLKPIGRQNMLEFVVAFSSGGEVLRGARNLPGAAATFAASARHWQRFWSEGGAVDFSDSRDPRATELERRVVLSQYLTAIQCAGSMPPQETGLTVNSWYGKFHLEMHWWHARSEERRVGKECRSRWSPYH